MTLKKQFDYDQVQNTLFLLIIPGFNSLFMMHWIHKNSVDDEKEDLPVILWEVHLMGGCFIYITLGLAIGKAW